MSEQGTLVNPSNCVVGEFNTNKMVRALSSIALEMQKFHASTPALYHNFGENQESSEKLNVCKSNLRLKKKQIKLLKQSLRNACVVAKTVMSAKEKETTSLHNHLNSARSDCIDLFQKHVTNTETIQNLISENRALQDKLKNLDEFIDLGYDQLQKIQNDIRTEKLPTVMKLKEIILSCGQYYANYSNEYDTRMQLEQKNRFLNNKIKILVNNLEAITEELKLSRHQNFKLQKENLMLKNKYMKRIENSSLETIQYATPMSQGNNVQTNGLDSEIMTNKHSFDLTSHLSLVKKLLISQDHMLKDLKKLSKELCVDPMAEISDLTSIKKV